MSIGTGLTEVALATQTSLVPGFGDVGNLLDNGAALIQDWGGLFLILMGTVAIVWAGWLALQKLMSSEGNRTSWIKIIVLLILGGALAVGGFNVVSDFGQSGSDTIDKLSTGVMLFLP